MVPRDQYEFAAANLRVRSSNKESLSFYREETPDELVLGNALEEYAFNIFEFEKARSGVDHFNKTLDTDNSSDQRSNFKKANKPAAFEIYVIPEVANEDEHSVSGKVNDGRSRDVSSQHTSSDNPLGSSREIGRRYFKESKRFRHPDFEQDQSLELSGNRDSSERAEKSFMTEPAESNAKERTFEDRSSNKDDSFKRMMADQISKYEKTHAKDFFLSKGSKKDRMNYTQEDGLEDSSDAPVKDLSYDFFKDPSSLLEKSKNKTVDLSDQGHSISDFRTNSLRLNDSDNPKFIDLGKFNSLDTSKNSESSRQGIKPQGHSNSMDPKPRYEGDNIELDLLPTRQTNKDKERILGGLEGLHLPTRKFTPIKQSIPLVHYETTGNISPKAGKHEKQFSESLQNSSVVQKLAQISKNAITQKVIESARQKSRKNNQTQVTQKKINDKGKQPKKETSTGSKSGGRNTSDFIHNIKMKLANFRQSVGPGSLPLKQNDQALHSSYVGQPKTKGLISPLNKILGKAADWQENPEKISNKTRFVSSTHDLPIAPIRLSTPLGTRPGQVLEKSQEFHSNRKSVNNSFALVFENYKEITEDQGPKSARLKLPQKNSAKTTSAGLSQSKLHSIAAKIMESKARR